jgi:hypothetical protein
MVETLVTYVTMTHSELPGVTKVVNILAYRYAYYDEGWRSADDPAWTGSGDTPPATLDSRIGILENGTVNVLTYGAEGNGVANDTLAIQAAIDAAPAGGRVWFPPGTYLVSAPIRLRGGLTYEGPGHALGSSAVIKQAAGANIAGANGVTGVLAANAFLTDAATCDTPIAIRHLEVDGNKAANPSSNAAGILVCSFWSWVDDCYVTNTPSHGVLLTDVTDDGTQISNSASENRIQRCRILDPSGNGIHQVSANTISNQDGYCVDNIVSGGVDGIRFQRGSGWVFRRNHTYGGSGHGIYLENCYATIVTENEIEQFGQAGGAGQHYGGISVTQLNGRGTHILGNFVGSNEPAEAAGSYQYISVTAGSGQTDAHVIIADNHLKAPASPTTKGRGLVLTGAVSGSVLHVRAHGNRPVGMATISAIGSGVVTYRQDAQLLQHPEIGAGTGRFTGAALGSSPPSAGGFGHDLAGLITFGTGTSPTTGEVGGINYDVDFLSAPHVVLTPGNAATAALDPYLAQSQTWGFVIGFRVAPAASQAADTYAVRYLVS